MPRLENNQIQQQQIQHFTKPREPMTCSNKKEQTLTRQPRSVPQETTVVKTAVFLAVPIELSGALDLERLGDAQRVVHVRLAVRLLHIPVLVECRNY